MTQIYQKYNKKATLFSLACLPFTPLESPAACSGDEPRKTSGLLRGEDIIPFRANTGFNAPCEPPRWKVEDFLTGFTAIMNEFANSFPLALSYIS